MEKKLKFKLNKKIGIFIILAIILIVSIVGVLFYNKFEFNIVGNEREGSKAAGDEVTAEWLTDTDTIEDCYFLGVGNDGSNLINENEYISKYDKNGNKVWRISKNSNWKKYIATSDGNIIVATDTQIIKYGGSTGTQELWKYSGSNVSSMLPTNDGGCITSKAMPMSRTEIGTYNSSGYETSGTIYGGGTIVSSGNDGSFIIQEDSIIKKYDVYCNAQFEIDTGSSTVSKVKQTNDNGCMLVIGLNIKKYNQTGNLEWTFTLQRSESLRTVTNDNGFITTDGRNLRRYDSNKTLIFEKELSTSYGAYFLDVRENAGIIVIIKYYGNVDMGNGVKRENGATYSENNRLIGKYKQSIKYTITLNSQSATSNGTTAIYGRYGTGIYLDSAETRAMTTSSNAITKPSRSYRITYNANGGTCSTSSNTAT
ncbi:PQQ-binding-like beta-propeller repeat protein, partial [uncultured Clostridium sp.]|uniref:PQQ-binding-like beta-propeller repeat protein n=1 Tax=uncultured Clostridium sp. TaxID=59620 RepID=UPI0026EE1015